MLVAVVPLRLTTSGIAFLKPSSTNEYDVARTNDGMVMLSRVLVYLRMSFSSVGSIKGVVGFACEDFVLLPILLVETGMSRYGFGLE